MPFWVSILIPLLIKLAEWLIAKRQANEQLTPRQQSRVNKVLYEIGRIQPEALALGCRAVDDPVENMMLAAVEQE